ncbi:hypothetical protein CCACVL1_11193 [Corchorus capsularis]|uniref:Coiled-coil domain-containing protein 22 n=1 Tax=Corchorus capsularis TaxID=210143 RepID=A0A1R3IMG8_COCAP|nr:hypothetical protein CCACVL1_11193 [Corchorus capsularis]
MEESEEILLNSLRSFGVTIPENVSSFKDLTSATLISICFEALNLLGRNDKDDGDNDVSFANSVEASVSMADKFKICTDISLDFKNLGYVGDMNYHKFLYPSEEDLYKLVRFLVERLSASPQALKFSGRKTVGLGQKINDDNLDSIPEYFTQKPNNEEVDQTLEKVEAILKDLRVDELSESSNFETISASSAVNDPLRVHDMPQNELFSSEPTAEVAESRNRESEIEETADQKDDEYISIVSKEQCLEIQYEAENLLSEEKLLKEELSANALQVQRLEEEFGFLKAAADMVFDESHPLDVFLEQLNDQVDAKKHKIADLESKWETLLNPLEEKKRSIEECLYANNPEAQEKLQRLRDYQLEVQFTLCEIKKREEEHLKLSADFKKQPIVASRRSYIQRIKEITKNSGKLDTDIERILRETRELQLESNSIQERLHRTYAVVDEIVFREAKKDPVGRQAYRLLTSIHESFEQISEKILMTDRIRREMADHEKKLAAIASRSLNIDKLQADLDAIVKENEDLEQQLGDN